jgi:hypothetical protein
VHLQGTYVNGDYSNEEKAKWNKDREKVMLENIKVAKKDMPTGIVICGFEHMGPLVELLQRRKNRSTGCRLPE